MNIAINAIPITGYGGMTFLRNMLPLLDQRGDGHHWYIYAKPEAVEQLRFAARQVVFRDVKVAGGVLGAIAAQQLRLPGMLRRDRIDLVYTANNSDIFLAPRPRVTVIRNVEPFLYQRFFNSAPKKLRCAVLALLSRLSLRSADRIVCVSEYARQVATGGDPRASAKAAVIRHGIGEPFSPRNPRPDCAPADYLFTSARMIGYSNLTNVVEAYKICRDQGLDMPLLVTGGRHDDHYERLVKRRVEELGLAAHVRFLGYVDTRTMAGLMPNARVFIFGSLLEACPNTLLEALRCGAAVVASDTPPNREIGGASVAWCDGRSPWEMASAILRVARNQEYAAALRQKAVSRAEQYSWSSTADSLVRLLERTADDYRRHRAPHAPAELAGRIGGS